MARRGAEEPIVREVDGPDGARVTLIRVDHCEPNTWNDNEMDKGTYAKVLGGVKHIHKVYGVAAVPAIEVRPHPKKDGFYEIIDGEHRFMMFRDDLDEPYIPAQIKHYSDADAKIMTHSLNANRGVANKDKYGALLASVVNEGVAIEDLAARLPEDADEISELLDQQGVDLALLQAAQGDDDEQLPDDEEEDDSANRRTNNTWVKLDFLLAAEQAETVERAVARVAGMLEGKRRRERALEFICADLLATPAEQIQRSLGVYSASTRKPGLFDGLGLTPR